MRDPKSYAIYNGSKFMKYIRAYDADNASEYAISEYGRDAYADADFNRFGHHNGYWAEYSKAPIIDQDQHR